jgi:hypothetical protein
MSCRVLTTDDMDHDNITLTIAPATAQPYSPGGRISSLEASLSVPLSDRASLLDLSFTSVPQTVFKAGE